MKFANHHPTTTMKKKVINYVTALKSARITVSVVREDSHDAAPTDTPERLAEFWKTIIAEQPDHEADKESLVVVLLNARFRPFAWNRISLGTVDSCVAHPRDIIRPVIVGGAYGFALAHNHPSGDPTPSDADLRITRRMVEVSGLIQIRFLDHLIVGEPSPGRQGYYSFREAGIIR